MAEQIGLEVLSPSNSSAIRKTCYFCRSRKIRCSGGQVCTACRARNLGCVYSKEASKGRPKGRMSASVARKSVLQKELDTAVSPGYLPVQMDNKEQTLSSLIHFPLHRPKSKPWPTPVRTDFDNTTRGPINAGDHLFGATLENVFRCKFRGSLTPVEAARPAHSAIDSEFDFLCPESMSDTRKGPCTDNNFGLFPKTSPFLSLSQGLVELVSQRFGSLGCFQREDDPADFVSSLPTQDDTATIFADDTEPESMPRYSDHQLCQMIELWILHHPLSFLVSKTLLLNSYRNKTHDQILFAVVLGGACLALGGAESMQGHRFFHWAHIHLRRRNAGSPSISTIQVLILLGWYELCRLNARRAFCYVELARIALKDIQRRYDDVPPTKVDWINGVDVGEVELEVCQRMYWLTFGLNLWASMQLNISFDVQAVPGKEIILPPLKKEFSAVYNLDERSGNLAVLKEQEKAMQELWPLSHIASTVGHIYALYPRQAATGPTSPTADWASQILPQLRRLANDPKDFQSVCKSVRHILSDGINAFLAPPGNQSSECFVLSAYRILIIHLMFPRPDPGVHTECILDANSDDIIHFVSAFKDHAERLCESPSDCTLKDLGYFQPSLLVLGLDTCSRALNQLQTSRKAKTTGENGWSTSRRDELTELVDGLHRTCKNPRLCTASTLPLVKRNLKCLKKDLESFGRPISTEDWLFGPADSFPGWFPRASNPQMTPMSGASVFDIPVPFDLPELTSNWTEENGEKPCNSAGTSEEVSHH